MIAAIPVVEPSAAMSKVVPRILGFKLLGELRNEFRAEGVGAFDDDFLGARWRSCQGEAGENGRYVVFIR